MELRKLKNFNNPKALIEGWYWALRSDELKAGECRPFRLAGKELVLWRGESGKVFAMDAFCPHMGAHLGEGSVEGDGIRCLFHNWRFDGAGRCTDIPCLQKPPAMRSQRTWPTEERYGLIWLHAGAIPKGPIPFVPELEGEEVSSRLAGRFVKDCHPHVMMINAIDEQHFASVHPMAGGLASQIKFDVQVKHENNIQFHNRNPVPSLSWITRFLARFYRDAATYIMSYWYGCTGSVTLGPDFLHFHIIFALRPGEDGKAVGQTILVTKRRKGVFGSLANAVLLTLTDIVGRYFADGDTKIFRSIRFRIDQPIPQDYPILRFIQHTELQGLSDWESERFPPISGAHLGEDEVELGMPMLDKNLGRGEAISILQAKEPNA